MVSTHLCMGKVKGTVVVVMMSYDITEVQFGWMMSYDITSLGRCGMEHQ